jgi:uncharacterized C2H2 Zn-finger protein
LLGQSIMLVWHCPRCAMVFGVKDVAGGGQLQSFDPDHVPCPQCGVAAKRMKDRSDVIAMFEGRNPGRAR